MALIGALSLCCVYMGIYKWENRIFVDRDSRGIRISVKVPQFAFFCSLFCLQREFFFSRVVQYFGNVGVANPIRQAPRVDDTKRRSGGTEFIQTNAGCECALGTKVSREYMTGLRGMVAVPERSRVVV
jgi:hypothetical protein